MHDVHFRYAQGGHFCVFASQKSCTLNNYLLKFVSLKSILIILPPRYLPKILSGEVLRI